MLTATRVGPHWESAGHAVAAYQAALTYAGQGEQFGKLKAWYQLVQNKLANMLAEVTTIQLMCFRMAQPAGTGKLTGPIASLAKSTPRKRRAGSVWRPETSWRQRVAAGVPRRQAHDRHGGCAHLRGHRQRTYEGTDSIQSLIIGRDVTGLSAFA